MRISDWSSDVCSSDLLRRLRARIDDLSGGRLTHEGRRFIATELKVNERDVESMETRLSASDQSLNASLSDDSEDSWQDFLSDTRPNPEEVVIGMRDAAAMRIAKLAEPYPPLPKTDENIDVLHVTRTWNFLPGGELPDESSEEHTSELQSQM